MIIVLLCLSFFNNTTAMEISNKFTSETANNQLIQAIKESNYKNVSLALNDGANPNAYDEQGFPIFFRTNMKQIAGLLVQKGADVNTKSDLGLSILHWIADETFSALDVVEFWLNQKDLLKCINYNGGTGTALHHAVRLQLMNYDEERFQMTLKKISLFISAGIDVNAIDHANTALDLIEREKYMHPNSNEAIRLSELLRKSGAKTAQELNESFVKPEAPKINLNNNGAIQKISALDYVFRNLRNRLSSFRCIII